MSDTLELDFSGVKDFAPRVKDVPPGNYVLKVAKIEASKSKAGNPTWVVDSVFVDGPFAGSQIREYLTLTENALFKVKSWLEAQGLNIGKKKVKLPNNTPDLTKQFVGKVYGANIGDGDPYVDDKGETHINSEIKYHLTVTAVKAAAAAPAAETVTAPSPEPAAAPEALAADEPTGDVADQLESFDLDSL